MFNFFLHFLIFEKFGEEAKKFDDEVSDKMAEKEKDDKHTD